ncbi:MAG: hypothetical protein K940chlam7_00715 [Chlamydiae bacterium]|nr:hypothetical protein [Chlamydiota bacterium]
MGIKQTLGKKKGLIALCMVTGLLTVACCGMFKCCDVVITPPLIPGAEYVGNEKCKECHCEQHQYFNLSEHASVSLIYQDECGKKIHAEACETCHGPGSLHVEGGGDTTKIIRADPETCFACHLDIKGKFYLQYHHPVPEGRMTCSDCHNLHGNDLHSNLQSAKQVALEDKDEICFNCHKAQRGPFAFEHEALREGCTVCHNPHGSIVDRLLVAGPSTLCLGCHFESDLNNDCRLGGSNHSGRAVGIGASCLDCHTRVHGSNSTSTSLRE